jgi:opacity protein-like surface antigen
MPIIDIGAEYSFFEKLHQFKTNSGKQNFIEDSHKFGFHIGAGFSMFILDVITYYNYLPGNQYISFNLRATIPIYVNL